MGTPDPPDAISCADAAEWEAWLAEHHTSPAGVWVRIAKKHSGLASVTPDEAIDVALCYGWIDSQRRSHDESSFLQRFSRRRPGSPWSKINTDKVEALTAAGRMRPPGLAEVATAKDDGRWDAAYAPQRHITVPPDLAAALATNEQAKAVFDALDKTRRYGVILPLLKARTPEARARLVQKAVAELAGGAELSRPPQR